MCVAVLVGVASGGRVAVDVGGGGVKAAGVSDAEGGAGDEASVGVAVEAAGVEAPPQPVRRAHAKRTTPRGSATLMTIPHRPRRLLHPSRLS